MGARSSFFAEFPLADDLFGHIEDGGLVEGGQDCRMVSDGRIARAGVDPGFGVVSVAFEMLPDHIERILELFLGEGVVLDQIAALFKGGFVVRCKIGHQKCLPGVALQMGMPSAKPTA